MVDNQSLLKALFTAAVVASREKGQKGLFPAMESSVQTWQFAAPRPIKILKKILPIGI
jgi:hypothetical protein